MAAGGGKEMEIAIKIAGKVESSFKNALSQATKGLGTITKTVTSATAAAAAAVGAMGIAAINTGREFEGAMSQVAATMLIDKTTAEGQKAFETLEKTARECGASTAFSATEAAEALNYLALAGYDADKAAMALPTVLKLAGAGAMDLAAASDMVTDSMSALDLEANEANLTQFSDQLAQTASKANTSVAQLGEAILTVGGTAKGLAGGTTELNTALGILADNGLKGAEGGTHLRNIILSLQNPTDKAAGALKGLGVDVYDAQGNMRSLNDVFKDLQGAMDGMSNAQKDNVLSTLFNKTDLTAANAMLSNCTDRFNELSAAVENSAGACENMYAIQLDNLNGDIDILKSGLSDLGISIYKDLNGPLREMTQLATSMVGELSEAYKSGGMEGMVGAVGGCMAEVVNTMADYAPQAISMGVELLENFIGGMTENSGALTDAAADVLGAFVDGLVTLVPKAILAGIDLVTEFADSVIQQAPKIITSGTKATVNFVNGIIQRLPEVISTALALVGTLANSIGQNAPLLISAAIQLIGNLVLGIASMLPQLLQMGIQIILSLVQGTISNLPQLLQMGVQIIVSLVSGITQMLPIIIQGGIQLIIALIQGIIANLGNIVQAAVQIVITLAAGLIQAIPQLITAIPQLVGAIVDTILSTNWIDVGIQIIKGLVDGILSTGKSLWNAIKSLITGEKVDIPDTSSQGAAVVSSYASGISSNAGTVTAAANNMAVNAFSSMDTGGATASGIQQAAAFASGINTGLSASTIKTSGVAVDASGFSSTLMEAGTKGASDIGVGMTGNSQEVTKAAATLGNDVNTALNNGWNKANANAQTAMQRLAMTVTDAARSAASAVKAAFENMTITVPKPKLPEVNVSYDTKDDGNGGKVKIPKFNVSWNAMGGIFTKPTIFRSSAGMQGVGEAGPEAVLPLDTLWVKMKEILNGAIAASGGASLIETLIEKLKGIGTGGGQDRPELAGAGGPTIQYSPVYNLYGTAGKDEIAEAGKLSQEEFYKLMKQYERDQKRRKL